MCSATGGFFFFLHYDICRVRSDIMHFYLGGGLTAAAPTALKTAESQATVRSSFGCNNSTSVNDVFLKQTCSLLHLYKVKYKSVSVCFNGCTPNGKF